MTIKRHIRRLGASDEGSATIEMAVGITLLLTTLLGIFQMSIVYMANAGVQHALGEGARAATLFVPDGAGGGRAANTTEIGAKITAKKFGPGNGQWDAPIYSTNAANNTMTITVTYRQPTDLLFVRGPTVAITKSKTVHLSNMTSGTIS